MRDRFTYRGDSLWWFTELYLHKMRQLDRAVSVTLALEAARERHGAGTAGSGNGGPRHARCRPSRSERAHGVPVETRGRDIERRLTRGRAISSAFRPRCLDCARRCRHRVRRPPSSPPSCTARSGAQAARTGRIRRATSALSSMPWRRVWRPAISPVSASGPAAIFARDSGGIRWSDRARSMPLVTPIERLAPRERWPLPRPVATAKHAGRGGHGGDDIRSRRRVSRLRLCGRCCAGSSRRRRCCSGPGRLARWTKPAPRSMPSRRRSC